VILFSATLMASFQVQFAYLVFESRCAIVWADWKDTEKKRKWRSNKTCSRGFRCSSFSFLRDLAQRVNLSVKKCRTILKIVLYLYPYPMTSVPELSAQRLQFCEWFINTPRVDDATLSNFFFCDEA
jgi:hypothetical protein